MGGCFAQREHPLSEEEGLFPCSITLLSAMHVLVDLHINVSIELEARSYVRDSYLGYRHVEVEVETQDGTGQEDDKDGECGVFKVGQLDLHTSEFYSPGDG
jgi:hypothetical protein